MSSIEHTNKTVRLYHFAIFPNPNLNYLILLDVES